MTIPLIVAAVIAVVISGAMALAAFAFEEKNVCRCRGKSAGDITCPDCGKRRRIVCVVRKTAACVLLLFTITEQGFAQPALPPMPKTFLTTNCCVTNVPGFARVVVLQFFLTCNSNLLADTIQVAIESRTNALRGPWFNETQWMQTLTRGVTNNLTALFVADKREKVYRVRTTRIFP